MVNRKGKGGLVNTGYAAGGEGAGNEMSEGLGVRGLG
jgi:hypothetical protein